MDALDRASRTGSADLHANALVWDNHGCLPMEAPDRWLDDLDRYRRAGVDVAGVNIGDSHVPLEELIHNVARLRAHVKQHPDRYVLVGTAAAILEAKAAGKLAIFFDVEGAFSIGDNLSLIELYYELGVRWMAMVYNIANNVGSGCHDAVDGGLTPFGRRVVEEMDRVGMLKCCTHTGYRTAMDVMNNTDKPVVFSHSNPRALRDHLRNIPDELVDACARIGGVVCINGIGNILGANDASVKTFVDHIDHVVQRVGAAHVGVGLDYVFDQEGLGGIIAQSAALWPPEGGYQQDIAFMAPERLPEVTEELLRRGYAEDDVRGVLGGNLWRVARQVWV